MTKSANIGPSCEILAQDLIIETASWSRAELGEFMSSVTQALLHYDQVAFDGLRKSVRFIGRPYWHASIGRPGISPLTRRTVFQRDEFKCRLCGSGDRLELDHIVPFSRGGKHDESNFQTLCKPCNRKKGARI